MNEYFSNLITFRLGGDLRMEGAFFVFWILDCCSLEGALEETDEDLVEQGHEDVVQAAPRPSGLKQYYLETFLSAGPQAGIVDHLAQPPWV